MAKRRAPTLRATLALPMGWGIGRVMTGEAREEVVEGRWTDQGDKELGIPKTTTRGERMPTKTGMGL